MSVSTAHIAGTIGPTAILPSAEELAQAVNLLPAETILAVLRRVPPELLKAALAQQHAHTPPSAGSQAANRRGSVRQRALRGAKIIYNNRMSVVDAQVRDVSNTGCRMRVATAVHLPLSFSVQITGMDGERRCEVRWRNDTEIGVRFVD